MNLGPVLAGGAAVLAFMIFGGKAQAAQKKLRRFRGKGHGDAVVPFTYDKFLVKKTKTGKEIFRLEVQDPLPVLAAKASKKLGRQISQDTFLLAALMESEAGRQPDLARVAIGYAALTKAERDGKSLQAMLLPTKHHGKLGSQWGRYAATTRSPTELDIKLAEAILSNKISNPMPNAVKWDSPRAQDAMYEQGVYSKSADMVAEDRQNKEGLSPAYLNGVDRGELRLWTATV